MVDQPEPISLSQLQYETRRFLPPHNISEGAHVASSEIYERMHRRSLDEPEAFWLEQAKTLDWFKKPSSALKYHWDSGARRIEHSWFEDGQLNVSYNCLDRHVKGQFKQKLALIWQGEADDETQSLTYAQLHHDVCRFANVLKSKGVKKGDRVCIYLPMIPEAAIAMLACTRIGAIHSVVFAGFSAESLAHRILDSDSKLLVTANISIRGGKQIPLKGIADEALTLCPHVKNVIVVQRTETHCTMLPERDFWYHEEVVKVSDVCPAEVLNANDPLFILYTSGSTGKPKGIVHGQGGYLLHASLSHRYIFDIHEKDLYWCTADVGWVTGHSYGIYGPLANGATILMFEGTPSYPDPGRFWQIVDKYQVTVLYTAPTVIRSLIRSGDHIPKQYNLGSLRILGTVGEPINPEAWMWYYEVIGKGKCPVIDTWWQTETGGIMIAPFPGCHTLKPGSAGRPFFGVDPIVLRDDGTPCTKNEGGSLCIKKPWPGIMLTMWREHNKFIDTYFSTFKNMYFSGDGCYLDAEGDAWLLGRIDDVVNISGHRIGTAEVESALVSHEAVAEAAVVPIPDTIKGQTLCAFVTLLEGAEITPNLKAELAFQVRQAIGPIAVPDKIRFAKGLPKTRSGKIMRRLLRKIAVRQTTDLGDVSTLADPQILDDLLEENGKE